MGELNRGYRERTTHCQWMEAPFGRMLIGASDLGVTMAMFEGGKHQIVPDANWREGSAIVDAAIGELTEYFRGDRRDFSVQLDVGGTPFQVCVWNALTQIPYAATWSYQDLAVKIGRPAAVRAVGAANGKNPVSILVPCHRVVGKDGSLTGYAGGMTSKAWLLDWERQNADQQAS